MCPGDTLHIGWGCDSVPWLGMCKPSLGLAKVLIWGFESSRSTPQQVSWSVCAIDLALQMRKTYGWYYSWGAAGMDMVCQDLCDGCCKTLPNFSSRSDSQCLSPADSPAMSPKPAQSGSSHKATHDARTGVLLFPWVLFSHWRSQRLWGHLSAWCCTGLGEGQWGQYVATSLPFCCSHLGLSGTRGCFSVNPMLYGLSQWYFVLE